MNNSINSIWSEYHDELNLIKNMAIMIKYLESNSIYCRTKECTLGNLITDSIRDTTNTEI